MEIQQLLYFVKIVDLGSVTRAAEACFVSQPALSQAIRKLEKELGRPLFERISRKMQLTEAGKSLLSSAREILHLAGQAKERLQESDEAGTLRVGAIPTIAPWLLPAVFSKFLPLVPNAHIELHEDVTEACVRRCLSGEFDLAVVALPIREPLLKVESFHTEELFVAVGRNHPLAVRESLEFHDVENIPFITLTDTHCLSSSVEEFCQRGGNVVLKRAGQIQTILELIALGQGISLIPAMARRADHSDKRKYLSLLPKPPQRTLAVIRHRNRYLRGLAKKFQSCLKQVAEETVQSGDGQVGEQQ